MTRISFGVFFVMLLVVIAVEGYYYDEYYPEEKNFRQRKGDDYAPITVQEVSRPHKWLRLRQRSEGLLEDYRRRGYNFPYRQQTTYRSYRNVPKTNNVYNDQTGYQRYQTYAQYRQTHVKGPRSNSRREEYTGQSGRFNYPQETVEEIARRMVNGRPDYTNKQERTRRNPTKRKRNNKKIVRRVTEYRTQTTRNINNREIYNRRTTQPARTRSATGSYQGCRDTGMYCTFWKSIGCCEQELGQKYCRKSCGFCSPQQTICPSSYKYGCCFDGTEALDIDKSNCPDCLDKHSAICGRWPIMKDCDLHEKNSLATRAICPQTCGACDDYATTA